MACEIQLAGLSADKILDLAIGMSGAFKDATGTQIDNTIHAGLVALRKDEAFMQLLRGYLGPTTQAAAPQALDLATIMAIIAAIKQLIDLFGKLKGGGLAPSGYTPNDVARC